MQVIADCPGDVKNYDSQILLKLESPKKKTGRRGTPPPW